MRTDQSTTPFDAEHEDDLELTQQFWGAARDWHPTSELDVAARRTAAIEIVRDKLAVYKPQRRDTRSLARTRRHGVVASGRPSEARDATLGELGSGYTNADVAHGSAPESAAWDDWDDVVLADDPLATNRTPAARQGSGRLEADVPSTGIADRLGDGAVDARLGADVPLTGIADRLGVGGVDPRLVRFGFLVLMAVLLVPLALALRPSEPDTVRTVLPTPAPVDAPETPSSAAVPDDPAAAPAAGPLAQPTLGAATVTTGDSSAAAGSSASERTADGADSEPVARTPSTAAANGVGDDDDGVGDVPQNTAVDATATAAAGIDDAATVAAPAERIEPECPLAYTAGSGDSWYRIAEAAGVAPGELVELNLATLETPIFPGDEICLPAGATVPSPPTTAPPTTAPETTAPATTAPPTTTPATTSPASASEVEQIVRDVWPDELEERALEIAWVESRYDPNAYNGWCCYGVFQIYWSVHQSWLDDYGIHEASDLFDPRKNSEAAYALYRAAGGWSPWGG